MDVIFEKCHRPDVLNPRAVVFDIEVVEDVPQVSSFDEQTSNVDETFQNKTSTYTEHRKNNSTLTVELVFHVTQSKL